MVVDQLICELGCIFNYSYCYFGYSRQNQIIDMTGIEQRRGKMLSVVEHTCNPCVGGLRPQGQPGLPVTSCLRKKKKSYIYFFTHCPLKTQ